MDNLRVNGVTILENVPAIFDTGANYIFGDWERVAELYGPLGGTLQEHNGLGYYYREFRLRSVSCFIDSLQYPANLSHHWASPSVAGRLKSLPKFSDLNQLMTVLPNVSAPSSPSAGLSVRTYHFLNPLSDARWTLFDCMA
jgi:hypothetical protein